MKRTIEKAKKFAKIQAPNGYEFYIERYLYGCACGDEYPAFIKEIKQDNNFIYYKVVYFFKYYDKNAAICIKNFSRKKNGDYWQIVNDNPEYSDIVVEKLPKDTRFNVKLLFKYCK